MKPAAARGQLYPALFLERDQVRAVAAVSEPHAGRAAAGAGGRLPGWLGRWLSTYGRVPLFYFVLHFCLISGGLASGQAINLSFAAIKDWLAGYQHSLLRLYAVWVAVLLLTY